MAVEGLEYVISLVDQVSAPLKGVMKSIDDIGNRGKDAMIKIGAGVGGIVAAGVALQSAIAPAIEMNRALGEVRSLDVATQTMNKLQDAALAFSSSYGVAATDFVRSSYNIQSAVGVALKGDALVAFTEKANLLAKATLADSNTITGYIGTMFSVLKNEVNTLGQEQWIAKLTGQTATAVKMFKTTGSEMNAFFANLGAAASNEGINSAEMFAIGGTLQSTVGGAVAGTQYKSFIENAIKAQKELGLSFVDSQGKMLGMVDILKKIRGKFGSDLGGEVGAKINKAFGSVAGNLIKGLMQDVTGLEKSISELNQVADDKSAVNMANLMVDPWSRFYQMVINVKTAIGTEVLKVIDPIATKIANLGTNFVKWLSTYKNIARWIGYIVGLIIGATGLVAAVTLLSGIVGALKVVGLSFALIFSPILIFVAKIVLIGAVIYKFRKQFMSFIDGFIKGFKSVGLSFEPISRAFGKLWDSLKRIWGAIERAFGLFGGATDSVDTFTSAGEKVGVFVGQSLELVVGVIELIVTNIAKMADIFANVADFIIEMWDGVIKGWQESDPKQIFGALATGVGNIFSSIFNGIKKMFI